MSSADKSREPTPQSAQKLPEDTVSEAGEVEDCPSSSGPSSPSKSDSEAPASASNPADSEAAATGPEAPPLPNEPIPGTEVESSKDSAPPFPSEPLPEPEDDGWECHWNPNTSGYWFYNRFTGVWQEENPRVPGATSSTPAPAVSIPETQDKSTISDPISVAGGYNPAIHGDYDENAWYAKNARVVTEPSSSTAPIGSEAAGFEYASGAYFNRWTGQWQTPEQGVERHSDEAKSRRQMNAFFDVDAAANMHDGRSLKAERAGKKPSKSELKAFKEKRRAKKEEKRRAWLRD